MVTAAPSSAPMSYPRSPHVCATRARPKDVPPSPAGTSGAAAGSLTPPLQRMAVPEANLPPSWRGGGAESAGQGRSRASRPRGAGERKTWTSEMAGANSGKQRNNPAAAMSAPRMNVPACLERVEIANSRLYFSP